VICDIGLVTSLVGDIAKGASGDKTPLDAGCRGASTQFSVN